MTASNWPRRRRPDSQVELVAGTDGIFHPIKATNEGSLHVSVSEPSGAFGEMLEAHLEPVMQSDFVYDLIPTENFYVIQQGSGTATASSGVATAITAAGASSLASVRSHRLGRYRAGQGLRARFTMMFNAAAIADPAGATTTIGIGTAESGLFFGYVGGYGFSIIHNERNTKEIVSLQVTTKSSNSQTAVITLGGVAHNVVLTNGANVNVTAQEIATGVNYANTFPGWQANAVGDTIYFLATTAGDRDGVFSASFPTSGQASFSTITQGALTTTSVIPQAQFNRDTLLGTGGASNPSGQTYDPTKLTPAQIVMQYLGAGAIKCYIETAEGEFTLVHVIERSGASALPSLKNPSMPFQMSARNTTNTTGVGVSCSSVGLFIEGALRHLTGQFSYTISKTSIGTGLTPIFTIRPALLFNNKQSLIELVLMTMRVSNTGTKGLEVYLIEDGTLNNSAVYSKYSNNVSAAEIDTTATSVTGGTQKVSFGVAASGREPVDLDKYLISLSAGSILTIAAKAVSTTTDATFSLQWSEDQ